MGGFEFVPAPMEIPASVQMSSNRRHGNRLAYAECSDQLVVWCHPAVKYNDRTGLVQSEEALVLRICCGISPRGCWFLPVRRFAIRAVHSAILWLSCGRCARCGCWLVGLDGEQGVGFMSVDALV